MRSDQAAHGEGTRLEHRGLHDARLDRGHELLSEGEVGLMRVVRVVRVMFGGGVVRVAGWWRGG